MKQRVDDLALFGGSPSFGDTLHVGCPNVPDRDRLVGRLNDLLDRRWFTNDGPFVREFEQRLSEQLDVPHCVAVSNGTTALELTYRALDLSGEVIVSAFTFVATVHALQWHRIKPVFCDIDPQTHNLDPDCVRQAITPRTTGIVGVHLWGNACDIDEITRIGQEHNLRIVFDAAHAFGCTFNGIPIGSFGDAEVFSFHATKFVNCFEGGAIATKSAALAEKLRHLRNFGFSGYDQVSGLGTNGKMNEMSAAMGLSCLDAMGGFLEANVRNRQAYQSRFSTLAGLSLMPVAEHERLNHQYVVAEIDSDICGLTRDELLGVLWAENVRCRRYFYPGCHRMPPYLSATPEPLVFPQTERVAERIMQFPTGTAITPDHVECIGDLVEFCFQHGEEIRARLRSIA